MTPNKVVPKGSGQGFGNGYGAQNNFVGDDGDGSSGFEIFPHFGNTGNGYGLGWPWWAVQGADVLAGVAINREGALNLPIRTAIELLLLDSYGRPRH